MINSVLTTGSMKSENNHMKINELSKLTGIHPETIRMYRKKGLLHPQKLENGYYDYTAADYVSLAYIRKLRGYSFPIDEIAGLYQNQDSEHLLSRFRKEKEIIQNKINELQIPELNGHTISVSAGASISDSEPHEGFEDLYKKADSCVYKSKSIDGCAVHFCH